jgi:hypothetical protein
VLLVVAVYAGSAIGAPYYRYYRFSDIVNQEESFATIRSDDVMRHAIWATADSLGLPDDAYHLQIARDGGRVHISASYDDFWALPGYRRVVHFTVDDSSPLL